MQKAIKKNNKSEKITQGKKYRYQLLYTPGLTMSDAEIHDLVSHLRDVASTAFETLPDYQVLQGTRQELEDKVIAIAWRQDGTMAGFCSTVILSVEGVGDVLHLGLTVVRPEDRRHGLTHILTSRAVKGYLLRHKPLVGKVWISNCAAVLSSLVNVAMHFEHVYPSPFVKKQGKIMDKYMNIARTIDEKYRAKIFIMENAHFDEINFVFRGSVKGTVFQKDGADSRYYHRNLYLNDFYKNQMNFNDGDEVLQIGYASTFAAIKHMWNRSVQKMPFVKLMQQQAMIQNKKAG
ncbi:MAG: hypothetical protein ACOCX9_01165 [Spirochaetota bacterium]